MRKFKALLFAVVLVFLFASSTAAEFSFSKKVIQKATKSVVMIEVSYKIKEKDDFNYISQGSGVILNKKGLIRTVWHLTNRGKNGKNKKITVTLFNEHKYPALVVKTTPYDDYSLIQMLGIIEKVTPAKEAGEILSEEMFTIGYPEGKRKVIFCKIEDAMHAHNEGFSSNINLAVMKINVIINGGHSGGPLFNRKGEILGIATGKDDKNGYFVYTQRLKRKYNIK